MKKNVMMRLASFLLVAVLISTSAISGTYAKYTTQDSGADSARVAKWGVELQVFGNLYGETYGAENRIVSDASAESEFSVQSEAKASDVVAPGTKNAEGFEISLKGQPEVDGEIYTQITTQNVFLKSGEYGVMVPVATGTITAANYDEVKNDELFERSGDEYVLSTSFDADDVFYTLEDYVDLDDDYYPVVYELAGNTASDGVHTADSLNAAASEIAKKLGINTSTTDDTTHITTYSGTSAFETHTNLATEYGLDNLVLTWEWLFDTDGCGAKGNAAQTLCKADTILGNLQDGTLNVVRMDTDKYVPVDSQFYCLNTQFSIDITVTQVD